MEPRHSILEQTTSKGFGGAEQNKPRERVVAWEDSHIGGKNAKWFC